jgi:hypothetical protein
MARPQIATTAAAAGKLEHQATPVTKAASSPSAEPYQAERARQPDWLVERLGLST